MSTAAARKAYLSGSKVSPYVAEAAAAAKAPGGGGAEAVAADDAAAAPPAAAEDAAASAEPPSRWADLPQPLLEIIFTCLGDPTAADEKPRALFQASGTCRSWRAAGQAAFLACPWQRYDVLSHPRQLFTLCPPALQAAALSGSPAGPASAPAILGHGSSGSGHRALLKCFVRRSVVSAGLGGRLHAFTLFAGAHYSTPNGGRFLLAAVQESKQRYLLHTDRATAGRPVAVLATNVMRTAYTLAPGPGGWPGDSGAPGFGAVEAAPAAASAGGGAGAAADEAAAPSQPLLRVQYKVRVRGMMLPRRVEVELPRPPHLFATRAAERQDRQQQQAPPERGGPWPQEQVEREGGVASAAAAAAAAAVDAGPSPRARRCRCSRSGSADGAGTSSGGAHAPAPDGAAAAASSSALSGGGTGNEQEQGGSGWEEEEEEDDRDDATGRPFSDQRARRTAAGGGGGSPAAAPAGKRAARAPSPQGAAPPGRGPPHPPPQPQPPAPPPPLVLQNKPPHWNDQLRCWCLNFRGRVKLASVKNFQLVAAPPPPAAPAPPANTPAGAPSLANEAPPPQPLQPAVAAAAPVAVSGHGGGGSGGPVLLQFGKVEPDVYILDFDPAVMTAAQAFAVALTTFEAKVLL